MSEGGRHLAERPRGRVRPPGRLRRSAWAAAALLGGAALAAGCTGGGESPTERPPPSTLTVSLLGGDAGAFHVELKCDVADRRACAQVLDAVRTLQAQEDCPAAGGGDAAIEISGSIEGAPVQVDITRRTECGVRAYESVRAAIGP